MFDLTRDFSISDADHSGKKRKRGEQPLKQNSGAGDVIPRKEAPVTKMRKFQSDESDKAGRQKWVDVNRPIDSKVNDDDEDDIMQDGDDDDDTETSHQPLALLRRTTSQDAPAETEDSTVVAVNGTKRSEHWWHTFKYRPILGIVPVSGDDTAHAPEVVLVERPSWDLDLPPRFVGTHEQA